jgi:DNA polymerase III delta prime subunit
MPFLPLVGHDALRDRLGDQASRGTLPASLLLQGAPGIGKQRLALWLGQRLLCESDAPPCGVCQHCAYALQGVHPDLRWYFPRPRLKDSSDVALDEVARDYAEAIADRAAAHGLFARADGSHGIFVYVSRLIVQQAARTPAMARRKVFVVGDAERMVPQTSSQEAANAFLKLLEEPPADTTIIHDISDLARSTVRSRVVTSAWRRSPTRGAHVSKASRARRRRRIGGPAQCASRTARRARCSPRPGRGVALERPRAARETSAAARHRYPRSSRTARRSAGRSPTCSMQ